MTETNIEEAARRLAEAEKRGEPCAPVRDLLADVTEAYAAQELATAAGLADGRRLVGRKIGLTSVVVQKQLGVDTPDYGMLFADMDVPDSETIAPGRVLQPKVEAEIAFVMNQALDDDRLTVADILSSIDYALVAIEIVSSRIKNWDIRLTDTVADNGSSGLFVLGQQPRKLGEVDLRMCGMKMERAGELVSCGAGLACLGSPINAVLWLARTMVHAGRPLAAGDIVLSGALGPMVAAGPGDVFEASVEGLGSVRAAFGSAQ